MAKTFHCATEVLREIEQAVRVNGHRYAEQPAATEDEAVVATPRPRRQREEQRGAATGNGGRPFEFPVHVEGSVARCPLCRHVLVARVTTTGIRFPCGCDDAKEG